MPEFTIMGIRGIEDFIANVLEASDTQRYLRYGVVRMDDSLEIILVEETEYIVRKLIIAYSGLSVGVARKFVPRLEGRF